MPDESIRYTSRTHNQVRDDLIALIPSLAPDITSHGEDEPFIALVDMIAGVTDGLHYYLDKQALENYFPTVKLRKNALKLAQLVGYRPRRAVAGEGTISVSPDQPLPHQVFIPKLTQFETSSGTPVVITEDLFLEQGFSGTKTVDAVQGRINTQTNDSPGGTEVEINLLSDNPSEQLFKVTTYGEEWVEFRDSEPESPEDRWYHYVEETDGSIVIRFLGSIGSRPAQGTPIEIQYLESNNAQISAAADLSTPDLDMPSGLSTSEEEDWETSVDALSFTTSAFTRYKPKETVEQLRYSAPHSIHTRKRAVDEDDYQFLARQVPGVIDIHATLSDFYSREVVIHVLGDDITTVEQSTLDEVEERLGARNDLTLNVVSQAATIEEFTCTVEVESASGYTDAAATFDTKNALEEFFENKALAFGRTIRVGEIYSVANNLNSVDYVNVTALHKDGETANVGDLTPNASENVLYIDDGLSVTPIV